MKVCRREVVKLEELKKLEKKQVYQERLETRYNRAKEREVGDPEEEWRPMKESLVENAVNVCGKRYLGGWYKKG